MVISSTNGFQSVYEQMLKLKEARTQERIVHRLR